MAEKCFMTEDPDEADKLEHKLESLRIECFVETEPQDSGIPRYTFLVESKNVSVAQKEAKIIRAQSITDEDSVSTFSEAVQILNKKRDIDDTNGYKIRSLAVEMLYDFKHLLALSAIPFAWPIANWLFDKISLHISIAKPEERSTAVSTLALSIVTISVGLMILFLRLPAKKKED